MLMIFLLTILGLVWTLEYRWKNRKLIKLSEQLKSATPCWPLVGHAYKFIGNGEDHMRTFTEHFGRESIKQGGLTSFWMGNMLCLGVADAADANFILKNYLEKGFFMNFIRDMIGNGNLVAPVSIWRPRRKILNQVLYRKKFQTYTEIFVKYSRIMVQQLESRLGIGSFAIGEYFNMCTMDIMCELTCGEELEKTEKDKFIEYIKNGFKITSNRMVSPWQYNSTLFKLFPAYHIGEKIKRFCDEYVGKKISTKRRELREKTIINGKDLAKESNPKRFKSFLELLIKATTGDKQYTDKEVQEEILVLFMAGSDTTATTLGFATVMLARHPDVQEKVYEELKEVFGNSIRSITTEDESKLNFLDAVIKETLRLYTPAPIIARHSDRDLSLPSGVTIPANCLLLVNIWALHRNPKYWGTDAEQFRPERWLDVNFSLKHPTQYIPFSSGTRNCAGYKFAMSSMRVLFATLLHRYRIMPDTVLTTDGVHKPLRCRFEITMKNPDNFIVSLEKRI